MPTDITMTPATGPYLYVTPEKLEQVWGLKFMVEWSNLDPKATIVDAVRVDEAIRQSENRLHLKLRARYLVPLQNLSTDDLRYVGDIVSQLAVAWLILHRPGKNVDEKGKPKNQGNALEDKALHEIWLIVVGDHKLSATRNAVGPTGFAIVPPA